MKTRRRKGSAMVLTLFTIAATLTLGTTFLALSIGESRMSAGEKDALLARQIATYAVNWTASYMGNKKHWKLNSTVTDPTKGSFVYQLTNKDGKVENQADKDWMGQTFDYAKDNDFKWTLTIKEDIAVGPGAGQTEMIGRAVVTVEKLVYSGLDPDKAALSYLSAQPPQYLIEAKGYLYRGDSATKGDVTTALASRTISARARTETAADFALFLQNMRSWDLPGFNYFYKPNGANALDLQKYNNTVSVVDDPVGIPANYQSTGDIRIDGSEGGKHDPEIDKKAGYMHFFPTDMKGLETIRMSGTTSTVKESEYRIAGMDDSKSPTFTNAEKGPRKGLPEVAGYLDTVDANGSPNPGTAAAKAKADPQDGLFNGYIKAGTEAGGPLFKPGQPGAGVNPANPPASGKNVEFLDVDGNGPDPKSAPGIAKTQITFLGDGTFTVKKVGAYSGKPVADANTQLVNSGPQPISKLQNGLIYVDGGNVEVKGQVDSRVTIIAAASTDRPTTDSSGKLINPAPLANTIYKAADARRSDGTLLFGADGSNVPAVDGDRVWWPAWDPSKVSALGGDPTNMSAVVREGNLSITGDLTKKSTGDASSSAGLIAQNYILLSDQTPDGVMVADKFDRDKDGNFTEMIPDNVTLQVDAVLMSLEHSVQYGGFSAEGNNYWKNMGTANVPRPATKHRGADFKLNGSIIGRFADVEGAEPSAADRAAGRKGVGYTEQSFKQDETLKNALPPHFPEFDIRKNQNVPLSYIILAWTDEGSLKAKQ